MISNMATYFISDIHLSDHQPHLFRLFRFFIQQILQPNDTLYILGDLYEYWIGDDQQSQVVNASKELLKELDKRNISWYFLAGNRDFLVGKKFLKETRGHPLPEKIRIRLGAHHVLLMHGDTLCTNDFAYQAWRRKAMQPWLQKIFLMLPLLWRQSIARRMRAKSMSSGKQLTMEMMDVSAFTVGEEFAIYDVDIMIHGHVHRPGIHHYKNPLTHHPLWRYVLADWDAMGNFLRYDGQRFDLMYFTEREKHEYQKT